MAGLNRPEDHKDQVVRSRASAPRGVASGRRADAVRAYERCRRALARELEAEPEERTKKLYRRIIGG